MEAKLIKTGNEYLLKDLKGEVLAITSGSKEGRMLSLKNCQAIERGYDLDELKTQYIQEQLSKFDKESYERYFPFAEDEANILIDGFQKAIEFLGDKKFSEEDVKRAMDVTLNYETKRDAESYQEKIDFLKSLQQTEWDCIIEMNTDCTGEFKYLLLDKGKPKLDADGCIILKRK